LAVTGSSVAMFRSLRGSAVHSLALLSGIKLGFNAAAFGVMLGAGVDLAVDEGKEFCEVGCGPALDAAKERMNSRHFFSQFTF
jgi:hypothetical protein